MRMIGLLWLALLAGAAGGCSKSPGKVLETHQRAASPVQVLARVHWLGKERIAADTNSVHLMKIWGEPESAHLEGQTLSRLAAWLAGETNCSPNPHIEFHVGRTNRYLPLLEDLVQRESYLELRQAGTNGPEELALAIRLSPERAAFWQTNLAAILESRTGSRPTPQTASGWSFAPPPGKAQPATRLALSRAGDWSILDLSLTPATPSPDASASASSLNPQLATSFASLVQSNGVPFTPEPTNYWLAGEIAPAGLAALLGCEFPFPASLSALSFRAFGDGQNVHTRGELSFSKPLALSLHPWTVPENLISRRLFSLTALRGTAPFFARLLAPLIPTGHSAGQDTTTAIEAGLPDQVYLWDDFGAPFHNYFAVTSTQASNLVRRVAAPLMKEVNPRLDPQYGSIKFDTNNPGGLVWTGLYHAAPFLEPMTNSGQQFVYGGFGPQFFAPESQMPPELIDHLNEGTNLVYFDWEITGQRLIHWRYLDDLYRILFEQRGPRLTYTASLGWIGRNATNLLNSVTEVKMADPERLTFARKSTIGLSALEIDYLANWLELPRFPHGFTTLMETNPAPRFYPPGYLHLRERRKNRTR